MIMEVVSPIARKSLSWIDVFAALDDLAEALAKKHPEQGFG